MLVHVVHAFVCIPGIDLEPDLDYVELFSGQRALTNAMRARGLRSASFDYADDPYFDNFNGNAGFVHALHLSLKLSRGGGVHAGSPRAFSDIDSCCFGGFVRYHQRFQSTYPHCMRMWALEPHVTSHALTEQTA